MLSLLAYSVAGSITGPDFGSTGAPGAAGSTGLEGELTTGTAGEVGVRVAGSPATAKVSTDSPVEAAEFAGLLLCTGGAYKRAAGFRFAAVTTPPCRNACGCTGTSRRGCFRATALGGRTRRAGFFSCNFGLAAVPCRTAFFGSLGSLGARL